MMQNKLVENWLINAGELTFTTPFVQLLIAEGYTVLHVSRGNHVEQGKDIIVRNPTGDVECYQLKSGNIDGVKWYHIKSQIDELTELPPVLSSLPPVKEWRCFLVTNGVIPNATARNIADYSTQRVIKGFMPVATISRDELVERFNKGFGKFLPAEPEDIRFFFEMYCQHGDEIIDRKEFKQFFEKFLEKNRKSPKQKKIEAINASLVLCSYLLTTRYALENNIELINAWALLAVTLIYYSDEWKIKVSDLKFVLELIHEEIDILSQNFYKDVAGNKTNFSDASYGLLSEAFIVHKLKSFDIIGYISAHLSSEYLNGNNSPSGDISAVEKIQSLNPRKLYVSEFQYPLALNLSKIQEIAGRTDVIKLETRSLIDQLLKNMVEDDDGLPSPYYNLYDSADIILNFTKRQEAPETFSRRSYILWTAVLILVHLDDRNFLNERWKDICEISMEEFIPVLSNDLLLWSADEGILRSTFATPTQSWAELRDIAADKTNVPFPASMENFHWLVPYYLLAMPHRVNPQTALRFLFGIKPIK